MLLPPRVVSMVSGMAHTQHPCISPLGQACPLYRQDEVCWYSHQGTWSDATKPSKGHYTISLRPFSASRDRKIPKACWTNSLAYLEGFRPAKDLLSKSKVDTNKGMIAEAVLWPSCALTYTGCLSHCVTAVTRHHGRGDSYKGKHLIRACLQFLGSSSVSSWRTWVVHAFNRSTWE